MRKLNEHGIAMITTLLVLMLMSALLVGFTAVVMSDQRYRFIDRDRAQAFYAASGGVEKLTVDLGNLFFSTISPKAPQITALTSSTNMPSISGITYTTTSAPQVLPASSLSTYDCNPSPPVTVPPTPAEHSTTVGSLGYTITYCTDASGNPVATSTKPVKTGPYEGLIAEQTPYQLDVTARTSSGGEVHLIRTMEAVAIPVFQFGMFSDVDLSFFAGPNFNFGGRVHTNGNLFLGQGGGATLTLANKVTAVKEVIRERLQNNVTIGTAPTHDGNVSQALSTTAFRNLLPTEGSVVDGVGSALNDPKWQTVSLSTYNTWIRNGRTGAKALNLPLLTVGGTNPDLIRRAPVGEDVTNPVLFNERLYSKASVRILLSDTAADITGLPTVTGTAPVSLGTALADADWATTPPNNGTAYGPISATHPAIARSMGPLPVAAGTISVTTANGAPTISFNAPGIPVFLQKPILNAKTAAGVFITNNISCTSFNETTFSGCSVPIILPAGAIIYVTNPPNDGVGVPNRTTPGPGTMPGVPNGVVPAGVAAFAPTVTLNAAVALGVGKTLTLTAGQTTWGFSTNTFFVNDVGAGGTGVSWPVTCTGDNPVVNPTQFTGCTGVPAGTAVKAGGTITTSYLSTQNVGTIGGFIKVELADVNGVWHDITMEMLNYGIGDKNNSGTICADPTPNAIVRIQRLRDNGGGMVNCPIPTTINSYEYWPNALFDTREGLLRDCGPGAACTTAAALPLGGVMQYITIDVNNLTKWFTSTAPYAAGTGATARTDNGGFTVYFSDRRNNRNGSNAETSEYGFEDFVNPLVANGAPNNILDVGEDVNANGVLDTYGEIPAYNGASGASVPGAAVPLTNAARPTTTVDRGQALVNRAILFRRALKLVNGNTIRANGVTGLTVVAENPVYVQGDWNSPGGNFAGANAATAIIADAVTLLTNNWTDAESFLNPYTPAARPRPANSWYRMGIIAGKGMAFPWPAAGNPPNDFGTDGGAHNFLRYLEGNGQTVNYLGSIATFFYNRQAVGTYKCCTTVYDAPTRAYTFDIQFLQPALLPPNTPVFRDMNAVGFSQELRPGK
jgi:hypothetical protein